MIAEVGRFPEAVCRFALPATALSICPFVVLPAHGIADSRDWRSRANPYLDALTARYCARMLLFRYGWCSRTIRSSTGTASVKVFSVLGHATENTRDRAVPSVFSAELDSFSCSIAPCEVLTPCTVFIILDVSLPDLALAST